MLSSKFGVKTPITTLSKESMFDGLPACKSGLLPAKKAVSVTVQQFFADGTVDIKDMRVRDLVKYIRDSIHQVSKPGANRPRAASSEAAAPATHEGNIWVSETKEGKKKVG